MRRDALVGSRPYHRRVLLSGDLLQARRAGRPELDRIDDELFSTDYRSPTQTRHLTLLPEPPTVRLAQHAPARPVGWPSDAWPTITYRSVASPYSEDENGSEIVVLIGVAVLLVVAVAGAAVALFWLI
jgi:hypothetical protein